MPAGCSKGLNWPPGLFPSFPPVLSLTSRRLRVSIALRPERRKKQKQGQSADEGVREESYHRGKVPILKLALAALARVQEHNLVVFNVDMREKKMEDLTLLLSIK